MGMGVLLVLCWLNAANTMHLTLLLARQRFFLFNSLNIFLAAGVLLSVFAFFIAGNASRQSYLYSLLLTWGAAFIVGLFVYRKKEKTAATSFNGKQLLRESFSNGLANQASHLAGVLNSRMIYFLLPATALGVYSNAISLSEALMMLPGSLGQVLYATVLNNGNKVGSAHAARIIWWACLGMLLLAFFAILMVPGILYQFIFGNEFAGVKTYLSVLAVGAVFNGCYLILSYWQSANGRFINNFYATIIGFGTNAGCCLFYFFSGSFNPLLGAYSISAGFFALFLVSAVQFCKINGGPKSLLVPPSFADFWLFMK